MHITYDPLWKTLKARGISQYQLVRKYKISSGQLDRIRKREYISTHTILRLCSLLHCGFYDIMDLQDEEGNTLPYSILNLSKPVPDRIPSADAFTTTETSAGRSEST